MLFSKIHPLVPSANSRVPNGKKQEQQTRFISNFKNFKLGKRGFGKGPHLSREGDQVRIGDPPEVNKGGPPDDLDGGPLMLGKVR